MDNNIIYTKYIKYRNKYMALKYKSNNLLGGGTRNQRLIDSINKRTQQTTKERLDINNLVLYPSGHGAIFIGYDNNNKLRILTGAEYKRGGLEISFFGGSSNRGETVLQTVIRETVEELLNLNTTKLIVSKIESYLISNPNLYHIIRYSTSAYSYVFDIDVLATFIQLIYSINNSNIIVYLPINNMSRESIILNNYLIGNDFNIVRFMQDREIQSTKKIQFHSLNEVKFLSFPEIKNLIAELNTNTYNLMNMKTRKRINLPIGRIVTKILKTPLFQTLC
jgi:hypothetical protein